jgi:hypothetical protein
MGLLLGLTAVGEVGDDRWSTVSRGLQGGVLGEKTNQ